LLDNAEAANLGIFMERFSERHGYTPPDVDIIIRHEAPYELRGVIANLAYECGLKPHGLRSLVCRVLQAREDPSNWSAYPNIDNEVRELIDSAQWYEVYDILEAIAGAVSDTARFETEINKYFRRRGIGWQLTNGHIETRGPESFEQSLSEARATLGEAGLTTASRELHEALADLSRRPDPDVTGAIQHALAALECVARETSGNPKATLGAILAQNRQLVPAPLDQALEKLWGFASEQGRHLREGRAPSFDEAALAVHIAAAVSQYLSKKAKK
jgi:hypothetical protein